MNGLSKELEHEERERIETLFEFERQHWYNGKSVAGLDEAGRGPLAGPVVAAAVMFDPEPAIPFVDDSKKLSPEVRESLYEMIVEQSLFYGIGIASVAEIDRINIYQASMLAMRRALDGLESRPDHLLVDGRLFPYDDIPATPLVKGDSRSFSIAAASILAKVTRDRLMCDYDVEYPQYCFSSHKGYATPAHLDAIEQYGFCAIHRRSFHPKRFLPKTMWLFDDDEQHSEADRTNR